MFASSLRAARVPAARAGIMDRVRQYWPGGATPRNPPRPGGPIPPDPPWEGPIPPDPPRTGRRTRVFGRVPADRQAADPVPVIEAERATEPPAPPVAALTIDALGRKCPIPIIMLAEQIRDVPLGAVVAVLADDPAAYTDIPSWCTMKAHEFAGHRELPQGGWALYIRRRL